jgi:hypothetical protein
LPIFSVTQAQMETVTIGSFKKLRIALNKDIGYEKSAFTGGRVHDSECKLCSCNGKSFVKINRFGWRISKLEFLTNVIMIKQLS